MIAEAFREWLEGWWKNPSPIDPISRSNVFDAYAAGWRDGRRDARSKRFGRD
jgi:hypothetical protein